MTRLFLMRHGEAESYNYEGDFARNLTDNGKLQATKAAEFLKTNDYHIDQTYVSLSKRTMQTADTLEAHISLGQRHNANKLYNISTENLAEYIQELTRLNSANNIMIISHNPSLLSFVSQVATENNLYEELFISGFKPATIAILEFENINEWSQIDNNSTPFDNENYMAELTNFFHPNF